MPDRKKTSWEFQWALAFFLLRNISPILKVQQKCLDEEKKLKNYRILCLRFFSTQPKVPPKNERRKKKVWVFLDAGRWWTLRWWWVTTADISLHLRRSKSWRVVRHGRMIRMIGCCKPKRLPSGKLTWQWKMALLKMYSLFENGIFHCHVSFLGGNAPKKRNVLKFDHQIWWSRWYTTKTTHLFLSVLLVQA